MSGGGSTAVLFLSKHKGERLFDYMQLCFIPWSITHNVRELSGFFKDLRGTCLTRRLMALSLPGPDTLDAGIIPNRCRSIERSSLEGSVSNSHNQLPLKAQDRQPIHTKTYLLYCR